MYRRLLRATAGAAALLALAAAPAAAQDSVEKTTRTLTLGETSVQVNVYEKRGARVTFFAPHHNEQVAPAAAREAVGKYGGRLVELVALDDKGQPARRLRFSLRGKPYSLDPNRIFTEQGRRCNVAPEAEPAARGFAEALLEIVFAPGGRRLREGESFLVAVHNNTDSDERSVTDRAGDLTAVAFASAAAARGVSSGDFHASAAGVYLSNREPDEDNFVIVTTPRLLGGFAERGFNVVVQKPAAELRGGGCEIDDGSLSVYAALQDIPYVNLEADIRKGAQRQREMLEAVYQLLPKSNAAVK